MATNPDDDPLPSRTGSAERVLRFCLGGESYAIRVAEIGGVASCADIRELPGAPPGVLGLTEWRGCVLTVLDLPGLLGREAPGDPACLIRLGPPMEQTALHLAATVQLVEQEIGPYEAWAEDDQEPPTADPRKRAQLVRPAELVRRLELELRRGS